MAHHELLLRPAPQGLCKLFLCWLAIEGHLNRAYGVSDSDVVGVASHLFGSSRTSDPAVNRRAAEEYWKAKDLQEAQHRSRLEAEAAGRQLQLNA
ncbi:PIP5K2, partial [Symbiodinium necroappetens]